MLTTLQEKSIVHPIHYRQFLSFIKNPDGYMIGTRVAISIFK